MYLRRISCGISARFSAQSVSITPRAGSSVAITNPVSVQNRCTVDHANSGVVLTTSQRSLPARATRASLFTGSRSVCLGRAEFFAASSDADVTAYRSSYCGEVRSGGNSSDDVVPADL